MAKNSLRHEPMATAHALGATGALFYIACVVIVGISRPTYMTMMSSWFHGVNVSALPVAPMMGGSLLAGFITFSIVSWVAGYVFARFYNWFASM